jgi:cholesterol transport system auxiliary component
MKKCWWVGCMMIAAVFMSGCSELIPKAPELPSFYILNGAIPEDLPVENESLKSQVSQAEQKDKSAFPATLVVNLSTAAAGFDSARMVYSRVPYKLEYFAHSQWIDTPARMLTPLIIKTLKAKSHFSAVILAPGTASTNYLLDTQIIRLQQDFFSPQSRERFTLRATLIDNAKHTVIFVHELDTVITAKTNDPYAGVVAANEAVDVLLEQLAVFCNEALMNDQQ